jgi:hypothetical protein
LIELEQLATSEAINKRNSQKVDLEKLEQEFTAKNVENNKNLTKELKGMSEEWIVCSI